MDLKKINWTWFSIGFVVLAFTLYVSTQLLTGSNKPNIRIPSQASIQPPVELGESWIPQDESNTEIITQMISAGLDKRTGSATTMKRDAHPKHHGCVMAQFETDSQALPPAQRVGVFSPNQPKIFQAWIRFSNGDPDPNKPDAEGDVRGMAIKLMNVQGSDSGSQDFLLMNSKSFFIRDTGEYIDLMEALEGKLSIIFFALTHSRFREVIGAVKAMKVGNPLDIDYFSATPYKLGNTAVKWSAKSCTPNSAKSTPPEDPSPNFLGERLAASLEKQGTCFEFQVQTQNPTAKMPIEDPTVEWSENQSRYITIAKIQIPQQQNIRSAEMTRFCENLSFNPWRTLPEQRPLGAINRVRLSTYKHISEKRHLYNNLPLIEPTNFNPCDGETKQLCQQ